MNEAKRQPTRGITSLIVTWLLVFPLIYLCSYGAFSVDHADYNNPVAAQGGNLLSGHNKTSGALEVLCAYGIFMALVSTRARALMILVKQYKILLLLPSLALASTLWSQDPLRTLLFAGLSMIGTLVGFWLYERFSYLEQIELMLLIGAVATVSSFALVIVWPSSGISNLIGRGEWQGIYNMKNRCAINLTFLLTPALFWTPRSSFYKVCRAAYICLNIVFVIKTQARTGWILITLLLAFRLVFALLRRLRRRERLLTISLVALISVSFIGLAVAEFREIAYALGKDPTLTGRVGIWRECINSAMKQPLLGFGYSAFWLGLKGEAASTALAVGYTNLANAENGILELWLQVGLVGVAILLTCLYKATRNAFTCVLSFNDDYVGWQLSLLFLTLLSLVDGEKFMFPNTLDWPLFVLLYIGLCENAKRVRVSKQARAAPNYQLGTGPSPAMV